MKNLSLLFHKLYFEKLGRNMRYPEEEVSGKNEELLGTVFDHSSDYKKPDKAMVSHTLLLKVCYPGLLIGLGTNHSTGMDRDEISAGFTFDYVTGQPIIPGSTVKGVLRSHFKNRSEAVVALSGCKESDVKALEREMFDGGDVFFDAVIYDADTHGKIVGQEFITPQTDPLADPVPIKMLKILPDVRIEFRFRLTDGCMEAENKVELFRELLTCFGIGAKTNVGFGVLKIDETNGEITRRAPQALSNSGNRRNTARPEMIECPHCKWKNYRYDRNTGEERWNWSKGICGNKNCRRPIR